MLATWPGRPGKTPRTVCAVPRNGFPSSAELFERYAKGSKRDVGAIRWYAVLGCYKLGVLEEGAYAGAFAGKAERARGVPMHAATLGLLQRALTWIDSATPFP